MITETKEFLEIAEILAKSNISLDDCEKITHFIIELNNKNKSYERLIDNLKQLDLYEYELDYDYEEEPIDNYYPFNMEYYIENWFKVEEIDKNENNDEWEV